MLGVHLNPTTISPSSRHPVGKIPLAPNSNKNRLRINSCSAAFTFNVCQRHWMIPQRQVSNGKSNCTPYLATSGRLIMTLIDADNPRLLTYYGTAVAWPTYMYGYNKFGAVGTVLCSGSKYRALSFIPEVYLLSLAPKILQEPSSKLPCLFIL